MTSSEQQRILPPWLQGAISAPDRDDRSVDYGSSSVGSNSDYDSSEESSNIIELGYWNKVEEREPGFIQVQVEWSQLFGDQLSHNENSFVEVMQGPNLNMLELFMEEIPPGGEDEKEDGETPNIPERTDEEANRPIVDMRRSSPASNQKDYILWNNLFEFERLREEIPSDEIEMNQRENEEKRILVQLEGCGHMNRKGILSSLDPYNLPELTLDVLDADAMVLLRVCSGSAETPETVLGQCLIVIDSLRKIAVPDESEMRFCSHNLHSRSGVHIGMVKVGLRFRLPHEFEDFDPIKNREYFEEELMTETLFEKYDTNGDGYLTRKEFTNFVRDLSNVGGNIKQLEECDSGGRLCLGSCVPLPSMDLFTYIKHNHTLLVVCFDQPKYMRKHVASTQWERLGFVLMSLLWSLSVNCLVEIYMYTSRFWQVLTITLIDSCGKSLMNSFFIIAHLRCWSKAYHRCLGAHHRASLPSQNTCEVLSLLVFIVFLIFFATWLLLAMSPEQLYSSGYSFIPIWSVARVTEIFYWGTAWGFMVQYGSSQSAASTRWHQDMKEKEKEKERFRRAHLLNVAEKQWWQVSVPNVNWPLPTSLPSTQAI